MNPIITQPLSVGTNVLIVSYLNPYFKFRKKQAETRLQQSINTKVEEFQITDVKIDESNPNILRYILKDSN